LGVKKKKKQYADMSLRRKGKTREREKAQEGPKGERYALGTGGIKKKVQIR